ncbi:cupredoxin domain-containing protein [Pedosphaera parvula]|nr:plastocyanin/azurin family copper-binding protein [Pedosphaera parvula]
MRIQNQFPFKIPLAALLLALLILSQNSASAATTNVAFGGATLTFRPAVITINVGDTIVFSNAGGSHTVTGTGTDPFCGSGGVTTSCSHTFNTVGSFGYQCIPHAGVGMVGTVNVVAASVPPTISLTAPASGAVYAAPANVKFTTTVTAGTGSVTNVQYFANVTNSLGSTPSSPFNFTASNLAAGIYSLTGKAQNSVGLATTSSPVSITVVSPVAISNFLAQVTNGQFTFEHTANPGLKYVVEKSADLTAWSPTVTNTASSNSVHVSDAFQVGTLRFYRVGRLPNP